MKDERITAGDKLTTKCGWQNRKIKKEKRNEEGQAIRKMLSWRTTKDPNI